MEFFVRYFVELEPPVTAVEATLDALPKEWFLTIANKAHARALAFMLEADPDSGDDVGGDRVAVELGDVSTSPSSQRAAGFERRRGSVARPNLSLIDAERLRAA